MVMQKVTTSRVVGDKRGKGGLGTLSRSRGASLDLEGLGMDLPSTFSESDKADENFLRALQAAVLDLHILEGALICPTCKREYPVSKGIPNMLLQDDERHIPPLVWGCTCFRLTYASCLDALEAVFRNLYWTLFLARMIEWVGVTLGGDTIEIRRPARLCKDAHSEARRSPQELDSLTAAEGDLLEAQMAQRTSYRGANVAFFHCEPFTLQHGTGVRGLKVTTLSCRSALLLLLTYASGVVQGLIAGKGPKAWKDACEDTPKRLSSARPQRMDEALYLGYTDGRGPTDAAAGGFAVAGLNAGDPQPQEQQEKDNVQKKGSKTEVSDEGKEGALPQKLRSDGGTAARALTLAATTKAFSEGESLAATRTEKEATAAACSSCASLAAAGLLDVSLLQYPVNGCNLPPSTRLPVILPPQPRELPQQEGKTPCSRSVVAAAWGLQLHGSDLTPSNARIETAQTSRAFRGLVDRRRCVLLVDGFFEWLRPKDKNAQRQPFFFRMKQKLLQTPIPKRPTKAPVKHGDAKQEPCCSGSSHSGIQYSCGGKYNNIPSVLGPSEAPMLLGCLYIPAYSEKDLTSKSQTSKPSPVSIAVVTMSAKGTPMEKIHDRMPLLLSPEGAAMWLEMSLPFSAIRGDLEAQAKQLKDLRLHLLNCATLCRLAAKYSGFSPSCIKVADTQLAVLLKEKGLPHSTASPATLRRLGELSQEHGDLRVTWL
ncbi:hypothetical protein cyc_07247 [Cyclospora cayetanensis]|uniref:Uncharacterized protein n=1 Tax=Cyclospora cayetanensis TaxID=88456 RepID=A0A1D3D7H7_9EIME|nr:hypothetical protein cyc_07247 [Cyclospora cayetanensis]